LEAEIAAHALIGTREWSISVSALAAVTKSFKRVAVALANKMAGIK
jgi:hypothetical protein